MILNKDLNKVCNEQTYLSSSYIVLIVKKVSFIKSVPEKTLNSSRYRHMKCITWERTSNSAVK